MIDLNYCFEHAIAVSHTPGALTEDVAELTLALILAILRQVVATDSFAREERWRQQQLVYSAIQLCDCAQHIFFGIKIAHFSSCHFR